MVLGTVVANLLGDRNLLTSVLKGFCNAGEAVVVAWLLERWFGRPFAFCDLRHVVGFFAAAALATATSAVAGAAIMTTFHISAPFWEVWRTWFQAGAIGVTVVAPLLIELGQLRRDPPSRAEVIEGAGVIALIALISMHAMTHPTGSWLCYNTDAVVFPLLLWLAARTQRIFTIAGALVASIAVIGAISYGVGHFGDAAVPLMERVHGAQVAVIMMTVFALVLIALFTELRASNDKLRGQEAGFRRLLDGLSAAVQTTDPAGRITYCNRAAVELWGKCPELGKDTRHDIYRLYYPDGAPMPDQEQPCQVSLRERRAVRNLEALLERADGRRIPIIPCPSPLFDAAGKFAGIVNMHLDISERKKAEEELRLSEAKSRAQAEQLRAVSDELRTTLNTAGIGITRCSRDLRYLRANETYAAIAGLPLDEIIGRPIVEVIGEAAFTAYPPLHRARTCWRARRVRKCDPLSEGS